MRIYIIGNDGITLCREAPASITDGEIAVASQEQLHAAPLSGKRLLGLWKCSARCRKAKEGRRPRGFDRSAVVGHRGLARPGTATRRKTIIEAGRGHRHAAATR